MDYLKSIKLSKRTLQEKDLDTIWFDLHEIFKKVKLYKHKISQRLQRRGLGRGNRLQRDKEILVSDGIVLNHDCGDSEGIIQNSSNCTFYFFYFPPIPNLPLYPLPLGLPSAPGPSTCLMHPAWAGDLFHPR